MKNLITIFCLVLISNISLAQDEESAVKYEYLTINVAYGLKTSGFVNKLFIDIGKTAGHSLGGKVTNDNDKVLINSYAFDSVVDLINYLGKQGWRLVYFNEIKILNDTYYAYTMERMK